jgi:hypothetical protein
MKELVSLQLKLVGWYAGSVFIKEEAGLSNSSTASSNDAYSLPTRLLQYSYIKPLPLDGLADQLATTILV